MTTSSDQLYKADHGKLRPSLLLQGLPRSLKLLSAVLTYGAQKYEAHSWKNVDSSRYEDAKIRHQLEAEIDPYSVDEESGLLHKGHEVINALFILESLLEDFENEEDYLVFNEPPQDHKQ